MPYIPLLKTNTDLAMPQVPALDRVPRPQIDVRGVLDAMGDLGRSSRMPLINPEPFVEAAGAEGKAVGKGLMDIGDVMSTLAEKRLEDGERRAVNEFHLAMGEANAEIDAYKDAHPHAPETWGAKAQEIVERTTRPFVQRKGMRMWVHKDIERMATSWGHRTKFGTQGDADRAGFRLTRQSYEKRGMQSYAQGLESDGHAIMDEAYAHGSLSLEQRDKLKRDGTQNVLARAHNVAMQGVFAAVQSGSEKDMDAAIEQGVSTANWTKADADRVRWSGRQSMAQLAEVQRNQTEASLLGELNYRIAGGEEPLPSQIEGLVQSGRLGKATAAPYLERARANDRPLRGEWTAFIDEVSLYPSGNDPKFEIATDLERRARELNPDAEGMAQFKKVFEKAQRENGDRAKFMETSSLVTAQKQLHEAFAHPLLRRAWNEDLQGALGDTRKLQAFGIAAPVAEEIRAYMGFDADGRPGDTQRIRKDGVPVTISKNPATAFRIFQSATKVTYHDLATARKAGMSEWAWKLFDEARTAQEDGSIPASAQEKLDDAFSEKDSREKLQVWYQSETQRNKGVPPDDKRLRQKVGELTAEWLQGRALRSLMKPATPAAVKAPTASQS